MSSRALKPTTYTFLIVSALSSAGTGLIYPLAGIYIAGVRDLGFGTASTYFVVMAATSIVAAPLAGWRVDRVGGKLVVVASLVAEAVGMVGFAFATTTPEVLVAAVVMGAGNGAFFAALTPLMAAMESGEPLNYAFAFRYWIINAASGIGLLSGGAIVLYYDDDGYFWLFLVNGITSLVFAIATWFLPLEERTADAEAGAPPTKRAWLALRDRRFARLCLANTVITMFGFAMFDSVLPIALAGDNGAMANGMVFASIVAIAGLQLPLARLARRTARSRLLVVHCLTWSGIAGVALVWSLSLDQPSWALALVFGFTFGLGECFYAMGFQSVLVETSPANELGQRNGVASMLQGVALTAGPPIGFALLSTPEHTALWAAIVAAMILAALMWPATTAVVHHQPEVAA